MGKYVDLYRNVELGIKACASTSVINGYTCITKCPYVHYCVDKNGNTSNRCMVELANDRQKIILIMNHLDQLDKEVDPI